jgi:hypothetical protein
MSLIDIFNLYLLGKIVNKINKLHKQKRSLINKLHWSNMLPEAYKDHFVNVKLNVSFQFELNQQVDDAIISIIDTYPEEIQSTVITKPLQNKVVENRVDVPLTTTNQSPASKEITEAKPTELIIKEKSVIVSNVPKSIPTKILSTDKEIIEDNPFNEMPVIIKATDMEINKIFIQKIGDTECVVHPVDMEKALIERLTVGETCTLKIHKQEGYCQFILTTGELVA